MIGDGYAFNYGDAVDRLVVRAMVADRRVFIGTIVRRRIIGNFSVAWLAIVRRAISNRSFPFVNRREAIGRLDLFHRNAVGAPFQVGVVLFVCCFEQTRGDNRFERDVVLWDI